MTSLDFFGIKERVVDILKNDTTNIYSSTPKDKTLFRKIDAGAPDNNVVKEGPFPRMWVTNDDLMASAEITTNVSSNSVNGTRYTYRIKIIIAVSGKNGPKTEETLDDFTKVIIEKLQSNYDLRTPGGLESTRRADSSHVEQIRILNNNLTGDSVQGRELILRVLASA